MLQFQQYDASIRISPKSNDYDVDRGCYECYSRSDFHILVQNGNQGRSHRHGHFHGRIHGIRYRERKFDSFSQTLIPVTRTDHTQHRIYRDVSVPNQSHGKRCRRFHEHFATKIRRRYGNRGIRHYQ